MRKIGLFLLAVVMVVGSAGCSDDKTDTERVVYATENSDGTAAPPMPTTPTPAHPPPESGPPKSQEITIAKCLSSKGAVLYGASWCPYTQKQIESFKDGFQYLSYVECTNQGTICQENGVSAYPTWIIRGSRIAGYKAPTVIGSAAGCSW